MTILVGPITTEAGSPVQVIAGTSAIWTIRSQIQKVSAVVLENTTADKLIPMYLYWQYSDDRNLQAFVKAFNKIGNDYLEWFRTINLPVYAGNNALSGALLDWVMLGLYGIARPRIPSSLSGDHGPFNTDPFNAGPYNFYKPSQVTREFTTTDDLFKRVATWNLYRGDGNVMSITWIKRRIARFILGVSGVDGESVLGTGLGVGSTYDISVSIDPADEVTVTVDTAGGTADIWEVLKAAIRSGVCATPFEVTWNLV